MLLQDPEEERRGGIEQRFAPGYRAGDGSVGVIDGYDFNRRGGYFSGKGDRKNGNPKPRADTQEYGLHIVKLIDHMGVKTIHAAVVHDLPVENRVLILGNQDK